MNKITKNKRVFLISASIFVVVASIVSILLWKSFNKPVELGTGEYFNNLPIERMRGSFLVDVENAKELVGDADYVFVAKVMSLDGYISKHEITKETEDGGIEKSGLPYTNYSVDIIENLKGDLVMNTTVPLQKFGGLNKDGDAYVLFEDDELPVVGETYIFIAYADEDGTILVNGPNSNQKVDIPDVKSSRLKTVIGDSEQVEQMVDAVDAEIEVRERERFKSEYETE